MHPSAAALDQLVLADLSVVAEARRLVHLRGCTRCRSSYDERVVLHRALGGHPERPTAAEDRRMIRRALAGAGLPLPSEAGPGLFELLLWHPLPAAAALALCVLLAVIGLRGGPRGPAVAPTPLVAQVAVPTPPPAVASALAPAAVGRLVNGRGVRVNGRAAEAGAVIPAGSTVEVNRGVAELSVARGGTIRLFPGTTLTVGAGGERVELAKGKVWCLPDHNGKPFAVGTARGEARAVGTSFIVEQRVNGDADVRVLQGTVEVEDRDHPGPVLLHANQQTRLRAGRAPAAPRRYAPASDRSDWDELSSDLLRTLKDIFDLK